MNPFPSYVKLLTSHFPSINWDFIFILIISCRHFHPPSNSDLPSINWNFIFILMIRFKTHIVKNLESLHNLFFVDWVVNLLATLWNIVWSWSYLGLSSTEWLNKALEYKSLLKQSMIPSLASCVKTRENQWYHEPKYKWYVSVESNGDIFPQMVGWRLIFY